MAAIPNAVRDLEKIPRRIAPRDDKEKCHPERSEGSYHVLCLYSDELG